MIYLRIHDLNSFRSQQVIDKCTLLGRPQVVFLDEASSAMDEGLEHAMYRLLREALPGSILVSVGHRNSPLEFHTQELTLLGVGKWRLSGIVV